MALILPAAGRTTVLWKNGGGLTREVAVHPPGADLGGFDWRVSLAEVRQGGPFSIFPGIERHMAVIAGRLELSIAGRPLLVLSPESQPCEFPGDVVAYGRPLQTPVSDLNIMTRRGRFTARLRRCHRVSSVTVTLEAETTLLLALVPLCLQAPATSSAPAAVVARLEPLDAVQLAAEPFRYVNAMPGAAELDFWLIEIRRVVTS